MQAPGPPNDSQKYQTVLSELRIYVPRSLHKLCSVHLMSHLVLLLFRAHTVMIRRVTASHIDL